MKRGWVSERIRARKGGERERERERQEGRQSDRDRPDKKTEIGRIRGDTERPVVHV